MQYQKYQSKKITPILRRDGINATVPIDATVTICPSLCSITEEWNGDQVPGNFWAGLEKLCVAQKPGIIFQSLEI